MTKAANIAAAGASLSADANGNVTLAGTTTVTTVVATTANATTINSGLIQNGNSNVTVAANGNVTISSNGSVRMNVSSTGNLEYDSGYGSLATAYACRAWVNFNGTGTIAIRASGNVSSITDGGVGYYRVNFTAAMPDTNYSSVVSGTAASTSSGYISMDSQSWGGVGTNLGTTGWVNFRAVDGNAAAIDHAWVCVAVFR